MSTEQCTIVVCANQAWNLVNFREGLIRALLARGWRVIALAPPDPGWQARLEEMGCDFVPLPLDAARARLWSDLGMIWRIWRLMCRHRPAAWLSWTIKPNAYGALAARLAGVKAFPNVSGLGTAFLHTRLLSRLVGLLYAVSFRRCPTVFFQNEADLALFVEHRMVRADQARLLPGSGVDLERFAPAPRPNTAGKYVHFLMIARVLADKGVREFVAAAARLRAVHPDAHFTLMGPVGVANRSAIPRAELERWVEEGVIEWHGPEDDVRPAIASAHWIVLPSYREGLSRVLVEALAMGRPLVATDVPGCRDLVEEGENGFLARPRDADSLFEACLCAVHVDFDRWHEMARASRRLAEARYDTQRIVTLYEDALAAADVGRTTPARGGACQDQRAIAGSGALKE